MLQNASLGGCLLKIREMILVLLLKSNSNMRDTKINHSVSVVKSHFSDYASLALEYLALGISYPEVIVIHVLGNKQEFKTKSSRIFCCFEI